MFQLVWLCLSVLGQQLNSAWYDFRDVSTRNPAEIMSQQPSCNPVFKRFLNRLLNEVHRFDGPSQSEDGTYDASIKLSKEAMTEIQLFLDGDQWRTGALDDALNQILVDLRPHIKEPITNGIISTRMFFLIAMATTLVVWSTVSRFLQVKRMFLACVFVSIIWNWFYLYKIAFAEHINNLIQMENIHEKCNGLEKITWIDSLKEWYRSTWTLQDDPCKKYYEFLIIDPILLVPPIKAISFTLATFITEPLKPFGQGISEFLRALLKDLPVTLQIPVLIVVTLLTLVFMYRSVHADFQHGILALLCHSQREAPLPVNQPPQRDLLNNEKRETKPST